MSTVKLIEQRLVRPDGAVIWRAIGNADWGHVPPVSEIRGPWRYEIRELPDGPWTLLSQGEDGLGLTEINTRTERPAE